MWEEIEGHKIQASDITIAKTAQRPPKRILIGTSPSLSIWGMSPQGPRGLGMSTITAPESPVKEDILFIHETHSTFSEL